MEEKFVKLSIFQVYNWQFVHSIHLWVQTLGDTQTTTLEPLVYPLVQLINGTIKLNYTAKYYPLRFHLSSLLIQLSEQTGKFIPILPYYLDILSQHNFGKKVGKVTMKPMDFSCILRLSKSQMAENGFKDATIEHIYGGLLEALNHYSNKISFPEICVPALAQVRAFLKKCKVANYGKKMKTVKEKMEENSKWMQDKRLKVDFGVKNRDKIEAFEMQLKASGTPLNKFYETFKSVKEAEQAKKLKKEADKDYDFIPKLKPKKAKVAEEFKGLFGGSDDENDDEDMDDVERFTLKEERGKKRKKDESESESDDEGDDDDDDDDDQEDEAEEEEVEDESDDEHGEGDEDDVVKDFDGFESD